MRFGMIAATLVALMAGLCSAYPQQDLHAQIFTYRVQNNLQVGAQADLFRVGETVGVVIGWRPVSASYHLRGICVRFEGQQGTLVSNAEDFYVGPEQQVQVKPSFITGLPAGNYGFIVLSVNPDGSLQEVATHRFQVGAAPVNSLATATGLPSPSQTQVGQDSITAFEGATGSAGKQTYSDPQGRFRMEVPAGWVSMPLNSDSISFLHANGYATVMVYDGKFHPATYWLCRRAGLSCLLQAAMWFK
jgi:hypothetical protein